MGTLRSRELCQATGATPRGVRFYVERGLLPKPEGRGTGPIYTEEHLIRLRAIRLLRAQRVPVDAIRVRLSRMSRDEIIALGTPPAPPTAPVPSAPPAANPGVGATATAPAERAWSVDRPRSADLWERIPLLPGLELHARAGAGALVERLAAEIYARYSAGGGGPTVG
jgi:DNA-binding transcriptional MerR regulator